jgi:hypothetical protein
MLRPELQPPNAAPTRRRRWLGFKPGAADTINLKNDQLGLSGSVLGATRSPETALGDGGGMAENASRVGCVRT